MVGVVGSSPIAPTKSMSHSPDGGCRQGPTGNHARGCTGTRGQVRIWRLPAKRPLHSKSAPNDASCSGLFLCTSPTCGDARCGGNDRGVQRSRWPAPSHFRFPPHQPGPRTPGRRGLPWRDIGRGEQRRAGGGARSALRRLTRRPLSERSGAKRNAVSSAPRPQTEQHSAVARRAQPAADRDGWPAKASPSAPGREVSPGDPLLSRFAFREANRAAGIAQTIANPAAP